MAAARRATSVPDPLDADVLVAGAGPAGAATALGLARLGYAVCVVGTPRPFDACEGISRRVIDGLRHAGFRRALEAIPPPCLREVDWNGERRAQNAESLLWRPGFDAAVIEDLREAGIRVLPARIAALLHDAQRPGLRLVEGGELRARAVVEARGRAAPKGRGATVRGPESLAVLQRARGGAAAPGSAVFACADGWVWLARRSDGSRYLQFSVAADMPGLPKRPGLAAWVRERIARLPQARAWLEECTPEGAVIARGSTAVLHTRPWEHGVLRVGDAAMAVDPLSGNGIFQSLSSASTAPAVLNTVLQRPADAALALDFHAARLREIFLRFARTGRDFHRTESRWAQAPFWRARACWPDAHPAHAARLRIEGVARRAVVEQGFIREREVVITSDQPLGVWRVEDVELAPLLAGLPSAPRERARLLGARIARASPEAHTREALRQWVHRHGLDSTPEP